MYLKVKNFLKSQVWVKTDYLLLFVLKIIEGLILSLLRNPSALTLFPNSKFWVSTKLTLILIMNI